MHNMGERAIIRMGDPTSHHGIVIEGFLTNICMGKPIAGVGHKVHCPLCKGDFPIVEGVRNSLMMGLNIAVEGMKTSCGAVLIATQRTDTFDVGSGASSSTEPAKSPSPNKSLPTVAAAGLADNITAAQAPSKQFNEKFKLLDDATGKPLPAKEYAIVRENGKVEFGTTDDDGNTHLLSSTKDAESVSIYVEGIA
jgi:uncharacterized Zn-binding protein involved in type VI secretion